MGGRPPTPSTSFTGRLGSPPAVATWEVPPPTPPPSPAPPPKPRRLRELPSGLGLTEHAHSAAFYWRIPACCRALIGGSGAPRWAPADLPARSRDPAAMAR